MIYYKRKLPHIQVENMYNFITFRTFDSIDYFIKNLQNSDIENKVKQYEIDKYLDSSQKGSYLYEDNIDILKDILVELDNKLYNMVSFVIMPNHVHLLLEPKEKLSLILKQIKGKSAFLLNKNLKKQGTFWAREYYDKVIRNEKQLNNTINYILNNPLKVNLKDSDSRIYFNSDFYSS